MKIRRCPGCAQLVHFDPPFRLQRCWNCGLVCDWCLQPTLEEKLAANLGSVVEALIWAFKPG